MTDRKGYRCPPKASQFQPGKSGNPHGRPKASTSFKSDLAAEMRERVTVRDKNGRARRVTKQRALIKLLCSSALQNEKSAITALLAWMRYFGAGNEEPATETADVEDLEMIRDYVERAEAQLKQDKEPPSKPTAPKRKART